jgi:1,4-alpha-glucan branching enzyme
MKKTNLFMAVVMAMAASSVSASAQVVTTTPAPLQQNSDNVVLTYHAAAAEGNNGLANLPESSYLYAHIGLVTDKSASTGDWKYVVTDWPANDGSNAQTVNTDKNHLVYTAPNTYTLTIGNLREYFGVTDPSENIRYIAMVPRTADGRKQAGMADGSDILIDVLSEGFDISFASNADKLSPVFKKATTLRFTVQSTTEADLDISVNGTSIASKSGVTELTAEYKLENTGNYQVVATATAGGKTLSASKSYAMVGAAEAGIYPGGVPKMGTVKNADGSVTFCLAAPQKESAVLIGSWNDYGISDESNMKYQDYEGNRYFFTTVNGLDNSTYYNYYFVVIGSDNRSYNVGDPYCHLVLDYYNDKWLDPAVWPDMPQYPYNKVPDNTMISVYKGDMDDYNWSSFQIPDHNNLIVYEMLLRDFTGTVGESNGNGTVRQAIEKIPYLKELGVNAVEIMPVMEFNGNNSWGYNTNFYMAPDKTYGSPDDYKEFIDICHRNGIAVILDIVFNQSDGLHPWYKMYNIASNPFYNQTAPHAYNVLNDWNQDNDLVQQQWTDALKYWLTAYNVDGFRFDLVKGLGDNNSYGNGTDNYNNSRVERMKRLHDVIKSVKPDGIHINEDLAQAFEEIKLGEDKQIQWSNINGNSCQYAMGYNESSGNGKYLSCFYAPSNEKRPWGSTVSYAESHDEERMGYKCVTWGAAGVKNSTTTIMKRLGSVAAIMLMTPGPKMIWQFGELGADQTTKSQNGDNDTSPKMVVWNYLDDPDRMALHDVYKQLCHLRTENPDLFGPDAEFEYSGGTNMTALRTLRVRNGKKEAIAFINPAISGEPRAVNAASTVLNASNCKLVAASAGFEPVLSGTGTSVAVTVPPHSMAVFATIDTAGEGDMTADLDSAPAVYGGNGRIEIIGDYVSAEAYTLDGRGCGLENLAAGIYVVRVDGRSYKVVVR